MTNHTITIEATYDNRDKLYQCDTCGYTFLKHTNPFRIEVMVIGDHSVCHHIGSAATPDYPTIEMIVANGKVPHQHSGVT